MYLEVEDKYYIFTDKNCFYREGQRDESRKSVILRRQTAPVWKNLISFLNDKTLKCK